MSGRRKLLGIVAPLVGLWLLAPKTQTFRIVPTADGIRIRVRSEGQVPTSKGLLLGAREYRGRIVYDPLRPASSLVEVRITARRLEPVEPRMSSMDRDAIVAFTESEWVLDAHRWPEIAFVGSGVKLGEDRGGGFVALEVPGRLEIRGHQVPVKLSGIARIASDGVTVYARHFLRLRDHRIKPPVWPESSQRVRDELEIELRVFATREVENDLADDEVKKPVLTNRARLSGEAKKDPPEVTAPDPPVPPELEKRSELKDPKLVPRSD